jgi:hypothetical protein
MVGAVGAAVSFEEGAGLLRDLAGITVPTRQVERYAERLGEEAARFEREVVVTATTGVATFTDLAVKGAGTAYRLHATATGLEPADSLAFDITPRAITVTATAATMAFSGSTLCASPTSGSCTPTLPPGSLATGDTGTWTQTFDTSLPGTGKTLTPTGTVKDDSSGRDDTASYLITFVPVSTGEITGTVIFAPAAIDFGSGFPGQTVTSAEATVSWVSTDTTMDLMVTLDGPLSDGATPTPHTIATSNVWFSAFGAAFQQMLTALKVADLSATPPVEFRLRVTVPSAPAGTYSGTITWSVSGP